MILVSQPTKIVFFSMAFETHAMWHNLMEQTICHDTIFIRKMTC
jgi:hypothetical protein